MKRKAWRSFSFGGVGRNEGPPKRQENRLNTLKRPKIPQYSHVCKSRYGKSTWLGLVTCISPPPQLGLEGSRLPSSESPGSERLAPSRTESGEGL